VTEVAFDDLVYQSQHFERRDVGLLSVAINQNNLDLHPRTPGREGTE